MTKLVSLKNNRDFLFAYRRGKSFVHPVLVTYIIKNKLGYNRIGITTSKKIGNAVSRNRARRVIKQAFRCLPYDVKSGFDIVFVARTKTATVKMDKVLSVMINHLVSLKTQMDSEI